MRKQTLYSALALGVTALIIALMLGYAARRRTQAEAEEQTQPTPVVHSPQPLPAKTPAEAQSPFSGNLAYSRLSSSGRRVYEARYEVVMEQERGANVPTTDFQELETAYQALLADHGGIFWVGGYTCEKHYRGEELRSLTFYPDYTFSPEERANLQQQVDEAVNDWLSGIPPEASDYEKTKAVYERLVSRVKYRLDSPQNQNILSVFLYGESVCTGFAGAAQYLLEQLSVPCMIVYGSSLGEPHAWNLVWLEQSGYYLDAAWGRTLSEAAGGCSYAYLNLNDRDLENTHRAEMLFELPECTSVEDSYYVREGWYYSEFEEERLGEALAESFRAGERTAAVKLETDELYRQVFQIFVEEQRIAAYCPELTSLGYVENKELKILTFQWK